MKYLIPNVLAVVFFAASQCLGSTLPGHLSGPEVDRVVETVGGGSATRLLRSAEAYDSFPGIKLGLEVTVLPSAGLMTLGDGTYNTNLNLVPRLYMSKGLFWDLEAYFSFLNSGFLNSVSTYGGGLKWTYTKESLSWVSAAAYFGLTQVSAFRGEYNGTDVEFGTLVSKDLVRVKPFAGVGVLLAGGNVDPNLVRYGDRTAGDAQTIHSFVGFEFEYVLNFVAQLDLMNLTPRATFFMGKHF